MLSEVPKLRVRQQTIASILILFANLFLVTGAHASFFRHLENLFVSWLNKMPHF